MRPATVRVLVVDDDEEDILFIQGLLARVARPRYAVDGANTFESAIDKIGRHAHDVYLVDYGLGGRDGLGLMQTVCAADCPAPFLLVTGQGSDSIDEQALACGAADYLVKGRFDVELLDRSIRYTLERQRLLNELRANLKQQAEQVERTISSFRGLFAHHRSGLPVQGLGQRRRLPAKERRRLADTYARLLDASLESIAYQRKPPRKAAERFACELGDWRASARETIEIHLSAVTARCATLNPREAHAYVTEGRLLALETMGHLADFYRRRADQIPRPMREALL